MMRKSHGPAARLTVESLAPGGDGVGILDGRMCFVALGVPGDTLEVRITRDAGRHLFARIARIIDPGPGRRPPPCPLFPGCGGCALLHVDEAIQGTEKQRQLMRQFGMAEVPFVQDGPALGYRRLARLHSLPVKGGAVCGFHERHTNRVVDVRQCPVLEPALSAVLLPLRDRLLPHLKEPAEIAIVHGTSGIAVRVSAQRALPTAFYRAAEALVPSLLSGAVVEVDGVTTTVAGADGIDAEGGDGQSIRMPVGTFGQANAAVNRRIAATVNEIVRSLAHRRHCVEYFSGAGNFTVALASLCERMDAVEADKDACRMALENLRDRGLHHVTVHGADAVDAGVRFTGETDLVVLDPPRTGAPELCRFLQNTSIEAIIYISCNPATLKRDADILHDGGWRMARLSGFDMFPQTGHVEAVALLTR